MYIQTRYEWDERKNRLNQRKHHVSFEAAVLVFDDPDCLIRFDQIDESGEPRWHALGVSAIEPGSPLLLLVVHVYRGNRHGEEIIRILSARRAGPGDVRRYQEQALE